MNLDIDIMHVGLMKLLSNFIDIVPLDAVLGISLNPFADNGPELDCW